MLLIPGAKYQETKTHKEGAHITIKIGFKDPICKGTQIANGLFVRRDACPRITLKVRIRIRARGRSRAMPSLNKSSKGEGPNLSMHRF